ncbi:MAG: hypothetical protein ACPGRX_02030 [Bdellovibrionales bacterium]
MKITRGGEIKRNLFAGLPKTTAEQRRQRKAPALRAMYEKYQELGGYESSFSAFECGLDLS